MNKKYELTEETIKVGKHTLYRIRAIRDVGGGFSLGDLGGFIESESNLSPEGYCWVYNNACVWGNSIVKEDAIVFNEAKVSGNAIISEYAWVYHNAWVYGNACVFGYSKVGGNSRVYGNANIGGVGLLKGCITIHGTASIDGDAYVLRKINLNSGVWNKTIKNKGNEYLISTTLRSVLTHTPRDTKAVQSWLE